jgi:hypothetical protein
MLKSKIVLPLILLLVLFGCSSKEESNTFNGSVTYRSTVENADTSRISNEQFNMMYGAETKSTITLHLKDEWAKMLISTIGVESMTLVTLFHPDSAKTYVYEEGKLESCMWYDSMKANQEVPEITFDKEDTTTILGKECSAVFIDYGPLSKTKIYYSEQDTADFSLVKVSKIGFLDYFHRIGAVPLRIESYSEGSYHKIVLEATELSKQLPDEALFVLPKFEKMEKALL